MLAYFFVIFLANLLYPIVMYCWRPRRVSWPTLSLTWAPMASLAMTRWWSSRTTSSLPRWLVSPELSRVLTALLASGGTSWSLPSPSPSSSAASARRREGRGEAFLSSWGCRGSGLQLQVQGLGQPPTQDKDEERKLFYVARLTLLCKPVIDCCPLPQCHTFGGILALIYDREIYFHVFAFKIWA